MNMSKLQHLAVLIDSATAAGSKPAVRLSRREEQCLLWATRGKTHDEIADIRGLNPASVRMHLDTTRHELNCVNPTHAVVVAIAAGLPTTDARNVIPWKHPVSKPQGRTATRAGAGTGSTAHRTMTQSAATAATGDVASRARGKRRRPLRAKRGRRGRTGEAPQHQPIWVAPTSAARFTRSERSASFRST